MRRTIGTSTMSHTFVQQNSNLNTVRFLNIKQEGTQKHLGREMFVVLLWAFMTTTHEADVEDEDAERVRFIKPIRTTPDFCFINSTF